MDEMLELFTLMLDSPVASGEIVTADHSSIVEAIIRENHNNTLQLAESERPGTDEESPDISDYILELKEESPTKPPLRGDSVVINVIKPEHAEAEVTPSSDIGSKVAWYLSKLCRSTYNARLCDRENPAHDSFLDQLSGQVLTKIGEPNLTSQEENERLLRFNREVLKIYINSNDFLEAREAGSSPKSLAHRAHNELNIDLRSPAALKTNIGVIFTPPICYVLTDPGDHSLPSQIWGEISRIPTTRAQNAIGYMTCNLNAITNSYNAMVTSLANSGPGLSSTRGYPSQNLIETLNQINQRALGGVDSIAAYRTADKNSRVINYTYIGGGLVLISVAGITCYVKLKNRDPQNMGDALRGVVTAFGHFLLKPPKKWR